MQAKETLLVIFLEEDRGLGDFWSRVNEGVRVMVLGSDMLVEGVEGGEGFPG